MPEHPQIKGSEHLAPDELGYDPETLEPILKFDQAIVDKYPRVIEGIKAFLLKKSKLRLSDNII
jgi:hypothetical protein